MDFSSNFLYNTNIKHRFYRKVIFYKWLYARSIARKGKTSWNPVWYIIFRWLVQKDWKTCDRSGWKIKKYSTRKNYRFYLESPTNQQFIIIKNTKMEELAKNVSFSFWEKYDEKHTVIRLATSWATTEKDLNELVKLL